jgi:hypothetical protein
MKFFTFLPIAFPIYIGFSYLAMSLLNSGAHFPSTLDTILQFISLSPFIFTLPFTPLLKSLGMYTSGWLSLPTTGGLVLSLALWEIFFVLMYLYVRARNK